MIRAVFFDFYSVWTPDKLDFYRAKAELMGPVVAKEVSELIENYYHGQGDIEFVANRLKALLLDYSIKSDQFKLYSSDISQTIIDFIRRLHEHFLKVGILANLGNQELKLLQEFDSQNQLFEVIASPLSFKTNAPLLSESIFAQAHQIIGEAPQSSLYVSGNLDHLQFAANFNIQVHQYEGLTKLSEAIFKLIE